MDQWGDPLLFFSDDPSGDRADLASLASLKS